MADSLKTIPKYYDGTTLLSKKDLDGMDPEIFLCASNRTAGKTTWFGWYLVHCFLMNNMKFGLFLRNKYELKDCADAFFNDIHGLFFQDHIMTSKSRSEGMFHELFFDNVSCGYALPIYMADKLKRKSHLFNDIEHILFDEFQTESGIYLQKEVEKVISLHTSIARGHGKQVRRVPLYLVGNQCSLINPYYVELGISNRLRADTKFLRGNGWVLEIGLNESAAKAQQESRFNVAFSGNRYTKYASQNVYLNDNIAFVAEPENKKNSYYFCTLRYDGVDFSIRVYLEDGIVYCGYHPDLTYPAKIVVSKNDHDVGYVMMGRSSTLISQLRRYFEMGMFRFKDLRCKEAVIGALCVK